MARTVGIIGSGIGALAVGIRLLGQGFQVTLFESRSVAGGKAAGVDVEGNLLDSGPTILRMPQLFMDVFNSAGLLFGEDIHARMLSTHYRIYRDQTTFLDVSADGQQTIENIARFSSIDANHYSDFRKRTEAIYQENLAPPPQEKPARKSLFNFRAKDVLPLQSSVFQETARFFQDQFIQQAFSFHPLLFGRNPFSSHHRSLMLHAIEQQWGILYVNGGFHQVIKVLLTRFQQMGGQIALNTPVDQIIIDRGKANTVRLQSGKQRHFDTLISNLSPFQTRRLVETENKLITSPTSSRQSSSYFMLHLLCEPNQYAIEPHTILSTNNYGRFAQQVFNQNQLPEDPWLYLYAQKPLENGLQPLMVMTPVPNLGTPIEWGKATFTFRNRVIDKVSRFFPKFSQKIHFERISTPTTFQDEYNLPGGSPLFPPIRRSIPNLFYVGDNTWTGLGLIAALSSAEQVTKTILADKP